MCRQLTDFRNQLNHYPVHHLPDVKTQKSWPWSWVIYSHPIPFVPCRSMSFAPFPHTPTASPLFLKKGYFKCWTWISKTKVAGVINEQRHIVGLLSNWFAAFSFHINRPTIQHICKKSDLKFEKKVMAIKFGWLDERCLLHHARQHIFSSVPEPWSWVEVKRRSFSTLRQTYTFCPKYLRFSTDGFYRRRKSCGGSDGLQK